METKKLIFSILSLCVFFLFSCSNEGIVKEHEINDISKEKNNGVVMRNVVNKEITSQFYNFLSEGSLTTRAFSPEEVVWNLDDIKEISNSEEHKYCYMVSNQDNPDIILGGCGNEEGSIDSFFIFEKNGDIYTLKDGTGKPILDAKISLEKGEILFVNIYATSQTRASGRMWCGLGMSVAGGVAALFIPFTGGASMIGYAACWGLVSSLMC